MNLHQNKRDNAPRPGKLAKPYPVQNCASSTCEAPLADEAWLFKDLESDKLVVFCGDCAMHVELNHRQRFVLVAL